MRIVCGIADGRGVLGSEAVDAGKKAADAGDAIFLPVEIAVRGGGKESVGAGGVGAVTTDHVVGADHVAAGFRHFGPVFDNHALGEETLDGLTVGDEGEIAHDARPKAGVDEVEDGVLDATDVLIDGKPVRGSCGIEWLRAVVGIDVAVEVPARVDEGVHGVGLAAGRAAADGTGGVDEAGKLGEG